MHANYSNWVLRSLNLAQLVTQTTWDRVRAWQ